MSVLTFPPWKHPMNALILKNDRLDCGTWFVTAAVLGMLGLAALCGLIVANVRDPAALFMGPAVKSPQLVYLFLEGLALVWALADLLRLDRRGSAGMIEYWSAKGGE